MAADLPACSTSSAAAASTSSAVAAGGPFWYCMHGLPVRSDIRLPLPHQLQLANAEPAWSLHFAAHGRTPPDPDGPVVASWGMPDRNTVTAVRRGPGGTWISNSRVGTFHITSDSRRVDVYPRGEHDARVLALMLAGPIAQVVLLQLGHPILHASAVVTEHGAIAFLGPGGRGKSTMAASFLRRGAALLTDDALRLGVDGDDVCGIAGPPYMKIWPQTATQTLEIADELPSLLDGYDKRMLAVDGRFERVAAPSPLRALYLLHRRTSPAENALDGSPDVTIERLGGKDGFVALMAQVPSSSFLRPDEMARLMPTYARLVRQAPVRVLSFPNGFAHQDAVHARIVEDLVAGGRP